MDENEKVEGKKRRRKIVCGEVGEQTRCDSQGTRLVFITPSRHNAVHGEGVSMKLNIDIVYILYIQ